ncbi:PAS domain-containing protein [Desulfobotulus sp. H1]|uniref:histidine kinase n=1 Tax=Desulfobotulus pelophilus TaxID=2823377 RepID=A0ABT3N619_9BACT|nr:PAS domain-containing sensor histidine kinase [Desulfobotulus pelophilus]MCW7752907.1 PAS domain-containing protein [Desulfobotulus pelophilus]
MKPHDANPPAQSSPSLSQEEEMTRLSKTLAEKDADLARLRQDKAHLKAIIEHSPDIIMRFDQNFRHLFISRAIEKVYPMAAAEYIGKTHGELGFSHEECQFCEHILQKAFFSGEPMEGEIPFRGIYGQRIFNWRLIPEYGSSGKVDTVLCLARDITAQRTAEKSYAALFATMPYGFALHEIIRNEQGEAVDYRFLTVNPAFERLTGLPQKRITGKRVLEILPDTEPEWIERYGRVLAGDSPMHFESFSAAMAKHYEVTAYALSSETFVTLFHDISERKKLLAQLSHSQKMQAVGRLAGGVAHDFNNKLNIISGYAEFAQGLLEPSHPAHQDLDEILKASRSATELTRQLLTFARKEEDACPAIIQVNAVIQNMLNMLQRLIGENVRLVWRPGENLRPLCMDPSHLDQVLVNLCINARDAVGQEGRIIIETRNSHISPAESCEIPDLSSGEYVQISITDDGCGMSREVMEQVFEPFFTTKKKGEGTGLGLATVYGIIHRYKGVIRVYSETDVGTVFSIFLPAHQGKYHEPDREIPDPATRIGRETLILVEDDPALLALNQAMLERLGYTVLPATLPGDALRMAEASAGTLTMLITDVIMPEMNGPTLARTMTEHFPGLHVLFVSGYTKNMLCQQGLVTEDIHFLQKPFSFQELARKVREILDREGNSTHACF